MPGLCNLRQDGIQIIRHIAFFIFSANIGMPVYLIQYFRLNQVYLLLVSKKQILLHKRLSQISLDILQKSLILSFCKNKPISSGKKFPASERAFVFFYLAAALVGIMLG